MRIRIAAAVLIVVGVTTGHAADSHCTKVMRWIGFGYGDGYHAAPRPSRGQSFGSDCVWGRCTSVNSPMTPAEARYYGVGPGPRLPGQPVEGEIIDVPAGSSQGESLPGGYVPRNAPMPMPMPAPAPAPEPPLTPTAAPQWGSRYDLDEPYIEPAPPYEPARSRPPLQTNTAPPSSLPPLLPPGVEALPPLSHTARPSDSDRFVFPWRR